MPSTQGISNADWDGLAEWWLDEVNEDPAYDEVVTPLMIRLLRPRPDQIILDLGCGDGRVMAAITETGAIAVGLDTERTLLAHARRHGAVIRASLPALDPLRSDSVDAACVCLVLEHLEDHATLFTASARAVRSGGVLALVVNHPIFTAPASAPIHDEDGETLWRPGTYFGQGWTDEPAGTGVIRFHHRTMSELLTTAAEAGWSLDAMVELGVTDEQVARTPWLADQRHIPRLLGCRWINSGR